jgi:hypothetical protein
MGAKGPCQFPGGQQLNFVDYKTGTHAGSTVCFDCLQESFLSAQLQFHITVDFIEVSILLAGKAKDLLRQALHLQLIKINF